VTHALLAANRRTFASLRKHRNYRLFFGGQVVSVSGTWMQNIALAWLVLRLTHSPIAVGVLALCRFGPFTLFGLFAGVIADRLDNRRTVIGTQSVQMVLSAVLAGLVLFGHATVWEAYLLAFLSGTVLVLDAPSRQGLTFQMVGRDELPNAIALNSSLFNVARIFGPAIGGIVIAGVGVGWCFALNAVSFLAVLAGLLLMRVDELVRLDRGERPAIIAGTREGLAYVRHNRMMQVILGMMVVFATLCFNFNVLLPVLAKQTLHAGPRSYGILSAAFGAGALLGALAAASLGRASWKALMVGAGGFALTELLIAPLGSVGACAALLFVNGVFFTLYSASTNTALQLDTPDYIRGRVLGLYYYAWNGTAPLGGLLVGWLCARGGTELAFLVAGAAGLAMTVLGRARVAADRRELATRAV
jgi:MFS family permease